MLSIGFSINTVIRPALTYKDLTPLPVHKIFQLPYSESKNQYKHKT